MVDISKSHSSCWFHGRDMRRKLFLFFVLLILRALVMWHSGSGCYCFCCSYIVVLPTNFLARVEVAVNISMILYPVSSSAFCAYFSLTSCLIRVLRVVFVSEIFGDLLTRQQSGHQAELLVLTSDPLISA